MEKRGLLMKVFPWLLIVFGFLTLNMFQGFVAISCMVIGIVMLKNLIRNHYIMGAGSYQGLS
jgi:hypothetical protein